MTTRINRCVVCEKPKHYCICFASLYEGWNADKMSTLQSLIRAARGQANTSWCSTPLRNAVRAFDRAWD